jgi:hypothetical protein
MNRSWIITGITEDNAEELRRVLLLQDGGLGGACRDTTVSGPWYVHAGYYFVNYGYAYDLPQQARIARTNGAQHEKSSCSYTKITARDYIKEYGHEMDEHATASGSNN